MKRDVGEAVVTYFFTLLLAVPEYFEPLDLFTF
jgi:hypothetical protein